MEVSDEIVAELPRAEGRSVCHGLWLCRRPTVCRLTGRFRRLRSITRRWTVHKSRYSDGLAAEAGKNVGERH